MVSLFALFGLCEPIGSDVGFATEDWFESCLGHRVVEFLGSVHIAVVGDGDSLHTILAGSLDERRDGCSTIEDGVLRMYVKMNKLWHKTQLYGRSTDKDTLYYSDFFNPHIIIFTDFALYLPTFNHNRESTMENKTKEGVVTLVSYPTAAEAEVTASMLRSMGIEVSVINEISSIMLPYINDNRVRILVAEEDYQRARDLLGATPVE